MKAPRLPAARKALGQHFLVDARARGRIVAAAELSPDDVVVEIGPGRGALTRALADRAGTLVAVELDDSLAQRLAEQYSGCPSVTVVAGDARELDIASLVPEGAAYKVVGNLPYYAASPIIRRFLEADRKPTLMVVMVQREVAQGMTAEPGKMGLLSVATQLYGSPRIVAHVPPRAFRPPPKVTSSVVRIDVYPRPALSLDSVQDFFRLVRAGFSAPRKQIHNSLGHGLELPPEAVRAMLARAGIDPVRRPQTLAVQDWGRLYEARRFGAET
jgi:16S rRNA (adenine1518-N6/adenine1519-N6)-dimethyltransferase